MKIRNIDLGSRPVVLAPMEDVTDIGFRLLCRRLGASMVYSEFVAADALVRMVNKSLQKLTVCDDERPVAIQIYGRDPGAPRCIGFEFWLSGEKSSGQRSRCWHAANA